MGIERFIVRRGTPSTIWSDNSTNFIGAEKNYLPASRLGTTWMQPFLHTEMLLGSLTRHAHPVTAAPWNARTKSEVRGVR